MNSHKHLFPLLSLFLVLLHLSAGQRVRQAEAPLQNGTTKLFVFGDSYADTGNIKKGLANSWKVPYGTTFPGKPAGRFSDGRVFTDYIAKYLKVKSPIPYRLSKVLPQHAKYGLNFAFGGTGVFDTSVRGPNMTTQIDSLEQLIKNKVYTASDLNSSVALLSVAGNDYAYYLETNHPPQDMAAFAASVVNQTTTNMIRIKGLGVKKVVVNGIQPLGCLPKITATTSFQHCNATNNGFALLHNQLLNQAVTKLNQETKDHSSTFIILDLYDSFMSVFNHPSTHNIQKELNPCCVGVSSEYSCGSIDQNNVKQYQICDNPKSAFFWDLLHPTDAGWHAVYNNLRIMNAFQQIRY